MKIIAFMGLAQAGKSTLSVYTAQWYRNRGQNVVSKSFAGPLKRGLEVMGICKDTHPSLYRQAAQYLGTDMCRRYDPDWWVHQMEKSLEGVSDDTIVVIDDVRFNNEVQFVEEAGGSLILVDAGERIDVTDETYSHESEYLALSETAEYYLDRNGYKRAVVSSEKPMGQMCLDLYKTLSGIEGDIIE